MQEVLITERDILDEAKDNFLTYASEVLTDRAIPSVEDGLLSVQRKIIWTMEEYMRLTSKSKKVKCHMICGDTMHTAYFHGDMSLYGALCKMAQEYLMRYPLIDKKGNLGSQERNGMEAASRYTEGRPSIFADLMMNDFKKDVVPLKKTYNDEYMEPVVLPGLFPNAICNGKQAIGVSMAHNSAPNNLTEACNAIIRYITQGNLTIEELMEIMPGPDFPLGNVVINRDAIRSAFETGKSSTSIKIRGDYEIDGQKIIFTSIPYRTYRDKIKSQFGEIENLDEIFADFKDESNLGQNKLIFVVKDGVSTAKALNILFHFTDLQTTLSYNMNFIVNGTPKLCSMLDLIKYYVSHQEQVLIKATEFDKAKAEARIHILEGLLAAIDKIDEVIRLIKSAQDRKSACSLLMDFLAIDEVQASAILDMKLGKLTRLDKNELVQELKDKKEFVEYCIRILTDKETRNSLLIEKVTKLRDTYGDARRTKLLNIEDDSKEKKPVVEVIPEDVVVLVSQKGIVKRVPKKSFRAQRRNTVGVKTNGDLILFSSSTNTVDTLMVFSSKGKMYRVGVDDIPEGSNTAGGAPLSSLIEFSDNEVPIAYTTLTRDTTNKFILFATKKGLVKRVPLSEYDKMKRTGIITLTLKEGDELASAVFIDQEQVVVVTKKGMAIRFETSALPISSRIAQGVKGINLNEGDEVIAAVPITSATHLAIVAADGLGKRVPLTEFTVQNRGGKGVRCSNNEVAGVLSVSEEDNILVNGDRSSLVISAKDLPSVGKSANGNITLKNNNIVRSVAKV